MSPDVQTSDTYDALSRLASVSGPAVSITYAYDELGRRTRLSDATGATTYSYDGLGRLTQTVAPNGTLTYAYDRDGNRTSLAYPGGQSVTYLYSPSGRLTRVTDWAPRVSNYGYLPSGLVSAVTYPNGMQASYTYDQAQRLTRVVNALGATTITQHTYALDGAGNRVSLSENGRFDPQDLAYDGLNRLLSITGTDNLRQLPCSPELPPCPGTFTLESFTYDGATNTTSRGGTLKSPTATFTYDQANRLLSDGTRSFTWSAADRLTQRGSDTFGHDALGRLTSATVSGTTRTYSYDGDGLMRSRTEGAATTSFLYDPSLAPAPLLQAGAERIVYGLGPLYRVHADGTIDAFARDALGSVVAEVSTTGTVTNSFRYTAYGEASTSGALPLLGFAGELTDPSGFVYLRARWYDPAVGRFVSSDPVSGAPGLPETLNTYNYASGNPANLTDPTGLCRDPSPGSSAARYCVSAFIPGVAACLPWACYLGDNRGPESNGGTSRIELHLGPNGSIMRQFSDPTTRIGIRLDPPFSGVTIERRLAVPVCGTFGVTVACAGQNPFEPLAPPIVFAVTFQEGQVSAWGTQFPSFEMFRYDRYGAHPLLHHPAAEGLAGPLSLLSYGSLGTAPNK